MTTAGLVIERIENNVHWVLSMETGTQKQTQIVAITVPKVSREA